MIPLSGGPGTNVIEIRGDLSPFARDLKSAEQMAATSGVRAGSTIQKSMGQRLQGIGSTFTKTLTPVAGVLSAAFAKSFAEFDEGIDAIRAKTGATGKELERLGDSMKRVGGQVTQPLSEVGAVMGDLAARTHLTGAPLEHLSKQLLDLSKLTGEDAAGSVELLTRLFGDWSVATDKQSDSVDMLYRVFQNTGVSISSLSSLLVRFGAPLRQMGFEFEESAALLGKFEQEGVNTQLVMGSLRIALGKLAKEGVQDIPGAFRDMVREIENAGSAGEANALALELFGARAGPDMAAAIREGRFAIRELFKAVKNGEDTTAKAIADTIDWADKLKMFANRAMGVVGPIGEVGFAISGLAALFGPAASGLGILIERWKAYRAASLAAASQETILNMSRLQVAAGGLAARLGSLSSAFPTLAAGLAGLELGRFESDQLNSFQERMGQTNTAAGNLASTFAKVAIGLPAIGQEVDNLSASLKGQKPWLETLIPLYDALHNTQGDAADTAERLIEQHRQGALSADDLAAKLLEFGLTNENVNEILAVTAAEFDRNSKKANDLKQDLDSAGKAVAKFAGLTKEEFVAWRESAGASLTDLSGKLAKLSEDANLTGDELVASMQKQVAAVRDFRSNLKLLIERGAKPELIKSLIDMGTEGSRWAQALAESNEDVTHAFFSTRRESGKELDLLTGLVRFAQNKVHGSAGGIARDIGSIGTEARDARSIVDGFVGALGGLKKIGDIGVNIGVKGAQGGPTQLGAGAGSAISIANAAMAAIPGPQVITSTFRPGDDGFHGDPNNPAADVSGPEHDGVFIYGQAIYNWVASHFGQTVREVIWAHNILQHGVHGYYSPSDHFDHVHIADRGGVFVNRSGGLGLVAIGPGVQERVTFHGAERIGDAPHGGIVVNVDARGATLTESQIRRAAYEGAITAMDDTERHNARVDRARLRPTR